MPGLVPGIHDFFVGPKTSDSWKSSHKASARAGGTSPAMTLV